MNNQSAGAMLILTGMALLWAVWSERSPFRVALWGETAPKNAGEQAAADVAGGFWRGFWGTIPGGALVPGSPAAPQP